MARRGPARILVVDDEVDVANGYAAQLEGEYIVSTAYSGREALERIDAAVDVVLLDRRMPGVSGGDVLEQIRDRRLVCRVAMVTAVDPDCELIDMPFDDYVTKPISRENLRSTIERLLTCAEYERQLQLYYALSAKRAALLANERDTELAETDRFDALQVRLADRRTGLERSVARFEDAHSRRSSATWAASPLACPDGSTDRKG